ncbi:MAG: LamG-like jellyroll fold domain-containing protein [Acidobacteriota bacterium]
MAKPTRRGVLVRAAFALATGCLLGCGDGATSAGAPSEAAGSPAPPNASTPLGVPRLGAGTAVWESNRGGSWRLWRRALEPGRLGPARPLTAREPGRAHCCAHLSPRGDRLVYLSLPEGQARYPATGASGELRLLTLDGLDSQTSEPALGEVLVPLARTYFEHRAAVWRNAEEILFIDAEGRSRILDLASGETRVALDAPREAHGFLLDPTLGFATSGEPTFSPVGPGGALDERANLGGCQPYFTGDGRLGVWVAGAGGPIRVMDLKSRRRWTILEKSDPRLPPGRRYLYFPMPSRDSRALAWAASADEHDHTRADYDVFLAETDSSTLELIGPPLRLTDDPATDRFPDVWLEPLALGRRAGEAPLRVNFEDPEGPGPWTWSFGDAPPRGKPSHVFESAGVYEVVARAGESVRRGRVVVRPQAPPRLLEVETRQGGRELRLLFNEPVDVEAATLEIAGKPLEARLDAGKTAWIAALEAPLLRPTRVVARGVRDLASPPNTLEEVSQTVEPATWPPFPRDLVFLMQSARHPNRVPAASGSATATTLVEPQGAAFFDRRGAMVTRGGAFQGDLGTMERLLEGVRAKNELSLELTFLSEMEEGSPPGALFAFAAGSRRNLTLTEEGSRLRLRLRTPTTGPAADRPVVDLGAIRRGERHHLLVTYTPGLVRAYLDGEPVAASEELSSGFFHWRATYLRLGAEGPAGDQEYRWPWRGRLEGVAVYSRALGPEEALESHRRYADLLARRSGGEVPVLRVAARRLAGSLPPTLEEIAPYREALGVFEYRLEEDAPPLRTGETIRVVHRVLVGGEPTPLVRAGGREAAGFEIELEIEPFDAQPQLEALFLKDDLPARPDATLYWSERLE